MSDTELKMSEIIYALVAYAGSLDDPSIGWVGRNPSSLDVFKCERCGAEHQDYSKIEHRDGCSAKGLLDVLDKIKKQYRNVQ